MESGFRFKVAMVLKFQLSFEGYGVSVKVVEVVNSPWDRLLLLGYQLDFIHFRTEICYKLD